MSAHDPAHTAALDNPFWTALASRHADRALRHGEVARYPADIAPFLGLAHAEIDATDAFEALVPPGDSVYLLGVAPARVPPGWRLDAFAPLAQMIRETPVDVPDGAAVRLLDADDREDVLALTALVYPHYFRPRTMTLGRYFAIHTDGALAAMAGERLATDDFQEVSAICTHPDHLGRGHAHRLTALLTNDILAQGRIPYLHVSHANARAKALYERIGYRVRRDIGFWALRRDG
ncbi:GNAT family N-acetyltransferase [Lysobacter brunescens]|uniref:GNAT family N-acetyltransferase n=1 Tax=Lysobacter brunescens TaxID=262323 RepID=A0ABW2YB91_9GAMM